MKLVRAHSEPATLSRFLTARRHGDKDVSAGRDRERCGTRAPERFATIRVRAAAQLARWGGATVIGTVRQRGDLERVTTSAVVALDEPDPAGAIRAHAPAGVDRIIEVAFSDNVDLDAAVAKNQTIIAAYASRQDRPGFPFWPMLFANMIIRLLGSDDFPAAAKQQAAADLTAAARDGALSIPVDAPLPLEQAAQAHDRVDAGARARILLAIPD